MHEWFCARRLCKCAQLIPDCIALQASQNRELVCREANEL